MKQLDVEIIAVGTELLLGQIADTNSQWVSQQLTHIGANTYYQTVVGDNIDRLKNSFNNAKKRSNIMIVMGGLGPTTDDITREAFQKISQLEIHEHEQTISKIKQYYAEQNRTMTENNRRQARVFSKAKIINNKLGMAPGMIVKHDERYWIFLPGVPREMKQMMRDGVLPFLRTLHGEDTIIRSKIIRLLGIGESQLEEKIKPLIDEQTNPTIALLAQNDGNIIRLTAKAKTTDEAEDLLNSYAQKIEAIVGNYIYGYGEQTIQEKVLTYLKENNNTISAAESLTGGLFTEQLISLAGASQVLPGSIVSYDRSIKQQVLNVSEDTLKNYGTISEACATEMAEQSAKIFKTDYAISFTGVAGPDMEEGQPVGTVYIAIYDPTGHTHVQRLHITGDRYLIRQRAMLKGYELLFNTFKNQKI